MRRPIGTPATASRPSTTGRGSISPASMAADVAGNSGGSATREMPGALADTPSASIGQIQNAACGHDDHRQGEDTVAQGHTREAEALGQPEERGEQRPHEGHGAGRPRQENLGKAFPTEKIEHEQGLAGHFAPFADDELVAPEFSGSEHVRRGPGPPLGRCGSSYAVSGVTRRAARAASRSCSGPGEPGSR